MSKLDELDNLMLEFEADYILQNHAENEAASGKFDGRFTIDTPRRDALSHVNANVSVNAALRDFERSMQGQFGRYLQ